MDQPARLVFIGAPGSGKSTVVNRVVASWLDERRASTRASLLPSVVERETLTRSRPRAEISTMEARVREELSDACLSADGRRALAAVEAQAESFPDAVLPRLPTLVNVEVRDAPRDADFHVRITATYADERELEALVSKARRAFGLSAGPARRARAARVSRDREDDASSSSSRHDARRRSKKTFSKNEKTKNENLSGSLSAFERARVGSVLGCVATDDSCLEAALRNRDRPYLPARFRDFLGSVRAVDFRAPDVRSSLAAARLWLARAAGSSASRPGCLALGTPITIEVPIEPPSRVPVVLVDTPGVDERAGAAARDALERALRRGGAEDDVGKRRQTLVDAAAVVSDGAPGPNAALERALRRARTLEASVSDPLGPALALLWPLDRLGVREADAERFAAATAAAARAGPDASAARGDEDAEDFSASLAVSHEAQSPLRDEADRGARSEVLKPSGVFKPASSDRGWLWHLERARARVASDADGPAADGVATWHGFVLDSSVREGAAPLARFVDELLLSVAARRDARRNAAGFADDHSTAKGSGPVAGFSLPAFGNEVRATKFERQPDRVRFVPFREKKGVRVLDTAPSSPSSSAMNPFAFASPSKGDRVERRSLHVPDERTAAKSREKPRRLMPGPEAVAFRSDGEDGRTKKKKKKTVRFAPEAPEVFFAVKRNGATTKQTSGSVQPPSRKRRKPLLDISRNARGDATSRETERNGNGAKRNARPAKKTAVSR